MMLKLTTALQRGFSKMQSLLSIERSDGMTLKHPSALQRGFTLIELLLVAIILGILAAVVIPQFTNSSANSRDQALKANLANLRTAIDRYAADHNGTFPAAATDGTNAVNTQAALVAQLTQRTTAAGLTAGGTLGPYLRGAGFPVEPVSNSATVTFGTALPTAGTPVGWLYDSATGTIRKNALAATMDNANTTAYVNY